MFKLSGKRLLCPPLQNNNYLARYHQTHDRVDMVCDLEGPVANLQFVVEKEVYNFVLHLFFSLRVKSMLKQSLQPNVHNAKW